MLDGEGVGRGGEGSDEEGRKLHGACVGEDAEEESERSDLLEDDAGGLFYGYFRGTKRVTSQRALFATYPPD